MRPLALISLLACPAVHGSGDPLPVRDVLATAFSHPFLTDIEVVAYHNDTMGRVRGPGGPTLFRYPGIASVSANATRVPCRRIGPDLLQADIPSGEQDIEIATSGKDLPRCELVDGPAVTTPEEFEARAAKVKPGEELVVRDGIYARWKLDLSLEGAPERPVVIRPQTPGGVVFRRDSRLTLRGRHWVFRGFRFEHCNAQTVLNLLGSDCRVTGCQFSHCGTPLSTFAHIVEIGMGSDRNQVDHCYFTGSKSMSLSQSIRAVDGVGKNNRFAHNLFRDIYRYWINGQENIQIGQNQRDPTGKARPECLVEYNTFDHAWGDGEIISSKSTGNVIRHNVAAHFRRSAFTLRGGDEARFEGNAMVSNGDGVRVMGRRHSLTGNLILNQAGWGIYLETGSQDGQDMVATEGTLVTHNTIARCQAGSIGAMPVTTERPHPPRGNEFTHNILLGDASALSDPRLLPGSTARRNLLWIPGRSPQPAPVGSDAVVADPRLEGGGLSIRPAQDGPARNIGAPALAAGLPPLPPRPLLDLTLFKGDALYVQDPSRALDCWRGSGTADDGTLSLGDGHSTALEVPLTDDFVLEWEYQPTAFAAVGSLCIGDWRLTWGGVSGDGKPAGIIELRKGDEVVADGSDALLPSQQFRYKGGMNFKTDQRTAPGPKLWYHFGLLKRAGRLIVLLTGAKEEFGPLPVIVWEDRAPAATAGALEIEQRGSGRWRGFALHACEYAGDAPLPAPKPLTATASGAGRVALRWRPPRLGQSCEVYRATEPDFTPAENNRVAIGAHDGFDDFGVAPDTRYFYQVRAMDAFGRFSPFAKTEARTSHGGPHYHIIPASLARLSAPLVLECEPGAPPHIWAPPRTDGDPAPASGAEFRFSVDRAGTFALWGLVRAPDGSSDSFHHSLDGAKRAIWYTGIHPGFGWSRIGAQRHLEKGEHRLLIQHREPGTALAAVLVTDDLDFER